MRCRNLLRIRNVFDDSLDGYFQVRQIQVIKLLNSFRYLKARQVLTSEFIWICHTWKVIHRFAALMRKHDWWFNFHRDVNIWFGINLIRKIKKFPNYNQSLVFRSFRIKFQRNLIFEWSMINWSLKFFFLLMKTFLRMCDFHFHFFSVSSSNNFSQIDQLKGSKSY